MPTAIYSPENVSPAYHLRYGWTGWPTVGTQFPPRPDDSFFTSLDHAWQTDGFRRVATNWQHDKIQFTFSVTPTVSPIHLTGRVKGRLQHAFRNAGLSVKFSRKVGFRALGDNRSSDVARYIQNQVPKERFVDAKFQAVLESLTRVGSPEAFRVPLASASGRYWFNLHLVLVVAQRGRIDSLDCLRRLDRSIDASAAKHNYDVIARSWLLEHVHLGLRGNIAESPEEIGLAIMNNAAYAVGQNAIWQFGYYVGSFSEYDEWATRDRG